MKAIAETSGPLQVGPGRVRLSKKGSKVVPVERDLAGAQPQSYKLCGRAHAHRRGRRPRATQPVAELDLVPRAQAAASWKHCTQSLTASTRVLKLKYATEAPRIVVALPSSQRSMVCLARPP